MKNIPFFLKFILILSLISVFVLAGLYYHLSAVTFWVENDLDSDIQVALVCETSGGIVYKIGPLSSGEKARRILFMDEGEDLECVAESEKGVSASILVIGYYTYSTSDRMLSIVGPGEAIRFKLHEPNSN